MPVQADDAVRSGQAYLPMHWGDRFLKALAVPEKGNAARQAALRDNLTAL